VVESGVRVDVVVVGAGFAGLYMVHRLVELGFRVQGVEMGSGVGGTWFWNRYPGCRCDSESVWYSYSFLPEFDREWSWSERYAGQPEILRYLEAVADRLDLRRHFLFDQEVVACEFDEEAGEWSVRTAGGVEVRAGFCVTAVGCLSAANVPVLPGAESFGGESFHTGRWPQEGVDFSGKDVALIGTGASGIQAAPLIAKAARRLLVFQRTANYALPAMNGPLSEEAEKEWKATAPVWRRRARNSRSGTPNRPTRRVTGDVSEAERTEIFERAWEFGGAFSFLGGTFRDLMTSTESNLYAAEFLRGKIDQIVADPGVASKLKPRQYFGVKRTPLHTGYYETFNEPNVELIDLNEDPIEGLTGTGIRTVSGSYDVDCIVYATGFDAITGPLVRLGITGRDGRTLGEHWADGPRSYLGLAVHGFPNLFTITGPGSPSVLTNMPVAIEQHVEWIADCLDYMRYHHLDRIECSEDAEAGWTREVAELAAPTLYSSASSWYTGANIEGKTRGFIPYIGGLNVYRARCDLVTAQDYDGFDFNTIQHDTEHPPKTKTGV
jgi:cation diffusion facilitator CzcD-associated flavoprotein CzcO